MNSTRKTVAPRARVLVAEKTGSATRRRRDGETIVIPVPPSMKFSPRRREVTSGDVVRDGTARRLIPRQALERRRRTRSVPITRIALALRNIAECALFCIGTEVSDTFAWPSAGVGGQTL